ncbi:MAG: aspartate carbamoyltransferase catalytic subunit [Candidatus Aminicenantes bacterium]|nr:aspartate carbamoyltransferase catalytic subunit [Candidatus Aminicenantes bacterium]
MAFQHKHLLGIEHLTREDILFVLETADSFLEVSSREVKKVPVLRGKTIVNLFMEPSTRTRSSFELASKRLSADIINFSKQSSAVVKGESLRDTIENLEAMQTDAIIIRHAASGSPHYIASFCRSHVINAGDGTHEHPTQALLDAFTIRQKKKRFEGLKVVIVGDCVNSRVAKSNILCLTRLGAQVTLVGPPAFVPEPLKSLGADIEYNLDKALESADVVMMLRIQMERMQKNCFPSLREYTQLFGLTPQRMNRAKKRAILMHPGPINKGVELTTAMASSVRSVILKQVENGVAVRMAVLYLLLEGKDREITA